jgi:hypothetical protein
MQVQPQITTRRQHRVRVRGKAYQQPGELGQGVRRVQLVQIVDDQCDVAGSAGKFRQRPVDHGPPVELGGRRRRFRAVGCTGGMTDRAEQGQPELLRILLPALHLHDRQPVPLTRTATPRPQQRRLPAASRRRDDRHLLRRRAIQRGEKITPVDQPESCPSHVKACLGSAPDALPPTPQSSRYQASAQPVNGVKSGSGQLPLTRSWPGLANHQDPVMTFHLPGGQPGSVYRRSGRGNMTPTKP